MKNISILGDSITKGIVLDNSKYRRLDTSFVNMFGEKTKCAINNLSLFGCTVTKGLQIFDRQQKKIQSSDIVLTEFGGNDCDFDWGAISENPDGSFEPNTSPDTFLAYYENIIKKLLDEKKKTVILNLPPLDDEKYFKWISRGRNADNILHWLGGSTRYIYRWHEMYSNALYSIAADMRVPLIDIRSEFLRLKNYSDYLCEDGIHPNAAGHRLIYNKIFEAAKLHNIAVQA